MNKEQLLYIIKDYKGICNSCGSELKFNYVLMTGLYNVFQDGILRYIVIGYLDKIEDFPKGFQANCPKCFRTIFFSEPEENYYNMIERVKNEISD